ncbi:hypothetical protein OS176_11405 [Xanthomonadaceae bacterium XH05]|nr:hypothetical protein [Xanthomonadaceae bacterium XH05]
MAWHQRIAATAALGISLAVAPVRAQDDMALRTAEQVGTTLYQIDRAARIAAKEGERSRVFRRDDRVQGWVAEVLPDAIRIIYVGSGNGVPVGLYRVAVDRAGKVVDGIERLDAEPLPAQLAVQHIVGGRARGVERTICSNEVETVVLPQAEAWRAYVLPRAAFPDVYLLGGSYRLGFSGSGEGPTAVEALASECVIVQNRPGSGALLFAEDQALHPNELHVYINRLAGKPLYVTTTPNGRTWLIQDGRIHSVEAVPAGAG